ncbi:small ribosomal subunit protein uS11-like [Oscarella lobularis]|uniref:small ribosomal subunit protein uS11-like n=1 Tax=Oscarella lobularis TaxID=121494 RepID=UPI0033131BE5
MGFSSAFSRLFATGLRSIGFGYARRGAPVLFSEFKSIMDEDLLRELSSDSARLLDPRDRLRNEEPTETPYDDLPIAHVKATYNNTIVTITDSAGKTLTWASGGSEGFKNAKRGTTFAGQSAGTAAAKKALNKGVLRVRVKIKGLGPGRQASLKGLQMGGVDIVSITDVTPVPHGGCRPRKPR